MIKSHTPSDWRDLQDQVGLILTECGLEVEIEKTIQTVRGNVEVDVFARDNMRSPPVVYLCECKHWKSPIPKTVVHALRTVVADFGANWGLIISTEGFQRGAIEAREQTNLRLVDWSEFQGLFKDQWITKFMIPRLKEAVEPVFQYDKAITSRFDEKKEDKLTSFIKHHLDRYRLRYGLLWIMAKHLVDPERCQALELPLKDQPGFLFLKGPSDNWSDSLIEATGLQDFLNAFIEAVCNAVAELDEVFQVKK